MTDDKPSEDLNVLPGDKMGYKLLVASRINTCLSCLGDPDTFPPSVDALESIMYFNAPGLPFKDKVDVIKKELGAWRTKEIHDFAINNPYDYGNIIHRTPVIINIDYKYSYNLFIQLQMILAFHGMYVESRNLVDKFDESRNLPK